MAGFWKCPKCGERCLTKNREAHLQSDFCRIGEVYKRRQSTGWRVCPKYWLRTARAAGVPVEEDIVRLTTGRRYRRSGETDDRFVQEGMGGYWVPDWAFEILNKTKALSFEYRVLLLNHLVKHEDVKQAFIVALTLSSWPIVCQWLHDEIKKESHEYKKAKEIRKNQ